MTTDTTNPITLDADRLGFTVPEACRVIPCSRAHLYRQIKAGRLVLRKVGGRSIIPAKSLRALVEGEAA